MPVWNSSAISGRSEVVEFRRSEFGCATAEGRTSINRGSGRTDTQYCRLSEIVEKR